MSRSPLEIMIDRACGFVPGSQPASRLSIKLECCFCHKVVVAGRGPEDPKQADKAVFPCPECWPKIAKEDIGKYAGPEGQLIVKYYDVDGNSVVPSWEGEG